MTINESQAAIREITTDKDHTLVALVDRTIEVTGAVHSHASETGNHALMSRVDYIPSVLKKMSQTEILTVAGVVLEEAHRLSPEILQDEGISTEDVAGYKAVINEFGDVQSSPKEAVIDRSGATERLVALFAEARGIIKNSLDKLAPQYKRKNPEFYRRYKAARRVTYRSAPKPETKGEQAEAVR